VYPVGRLDADSEGLLLLTNDGEWAERVLHPRYGHEREYEVSVTGEVTPASLGQLRRGIRLEEGLARAERIVVVTRSRSGSRLRLVLRTGYKRQIRRMCAAVGLRVDRLVRIRIGSLDLGRLRSGQWRELTSEEIARLAKSSSDQRRTREDGPSTSRGTEGPRERRGSRRDQRRDTASKEGFGAAARRRGDRVRTRSVSAR
jgi:23S rRNA pseudouridine2605 synthase